ncbi:MAG: HAD family hydrolase [Candidatus Woesearchaeota archaeon]
MKLIIFDVDGVLDENYEMHYEYSTKKIIGLTREEHKKLFEGNIHVEREKLAHRDTGLNILNYLNSSRVNKEMLENTKKVLKILSQKYLIGVISSSLESGIKAYLDYNNVSKYISFIYGYETHILKEEKFRKTLNEKNLRPTECVYITDTLGDIKEATTIGVRCIGYTKGYHEKERLKKGNPIAIIDNLEEIIQIAESL